MKAAANHELKVVTHMKAHQRICSDKEHLLGEMSQQIELVVPHLEDLREKNENLLAVHERSTENNKL